MTRSELLATSSRVYSLSETVYRTIANNDPISDVHLRLVSDHAFDIAIEALRIRNEAMKELLLRAGHWVPEDDDGNQD